MIDYFSLLDEPRRPWIDDALLKQKFLAISAKFHPDRVHESAGAEREAASRRYADLNAAYNCLRQAKERIRHLLELELGYRPADIKPVIAEETDTLFEVGQICQKADRFLAEYEKAASPMLKVQLFERAQELTEQLMKLRQKNQARTEELLAELQAMNPLWEQAGESRAALPLERLDAVYRLLGYLGRWSEQVQERIVRLSF
jgi:DnaJ-domain-containing protein 1